MAALQLHKLDLHVHTPASHDFVDKSVTADAIVAHCQKIGLSAIAVTDHNTVDFIDKMKAAGQKKNFTVFPGIEISCGATQQGSIHIIAIFDPAKDKDDLQKVVGKLDITGKGEDALTQKGPADVIDIVAQAGGLAVLAHANSKHGALEDIRGNPRTALVKNKHLLAAEATAGNFARAVGTRLIDFLSGSDATYKRKLAVYKASDNPVAGANGHCVESIGSEFTYFRMGALTLESLRECFEDPDSRVIQDYEADKIASAHPRIEELSISKGFLGKQTVSFHHGMTSIIGGTGTGKSLTIELLRFVFDRKPPDVLMVDHKQKLLKQLGLEGEVSAIYQDGAGARYRVSRALSNLRDPYGSPITCVDLDSGKPFKGDLSSLAPLLIYSQNEILEITRDEGAQLRLLDHFQDLESYQNQITEIRQELPRLDQKLHQAIEDSANCAVLKKQLANVEASLEKLAKQIGAGEKNKTSKSFIELSKQRTVIEEKIDEFEPLVEYVDESIEQLAADAPTGKGVGGGTLGAIDTGLRTSYSTAIAGLKSIRTEIVKAQVAAKDELKAWEKANKYQQAEKDYKASVSSKKKDEELETRRRQLMEEKKDLAGRVAQAEKAAKLDKKFRAEREGLLGILTEVREKYYAERERQADLITARSGAKLRIVVQKGDNRSGYARLLKELAVGAYAEKKELDRIVGTIPPVDLVNCVLDQDCSQLAKLGELSELKAENMLKALYEPTVRLKTLAMQYDGYPEDRVEISYQKRDGAYYPLSELSMGQKADALVMIALGDGAMPVVIDQPEDALDIPSIWTDICSRLRTSKHVRQFIFTTHNSSISVSSDSDQFIVFEADGKKGWVARTGSIDEQAIKDDVVGHLEGGYESYGLKRKKYGL